MPLKRAKRWHGRRYLLNRPGFQTTAAIVAEIEDTSTWTQEHKKDRWAMPQLILQISDCTRSVSLDVDINDRDYENDLEKVTLMIDALQKLQAGMVLERRRWVARQKKYGFESED